MSLNIPVALDLFSGMAKGYGAYQTGKRQSTELKFEAEQFRINANQAKAASQRDAEEETRQAALVQSRILAVAAASGAGASDPTVVRLIGKQAGEGAYRAALAIYRGDEQARQNMNAANAREYEAKAAVAAGKTRAFASLVGTGASLYQRFSNGGPAQTEDMATTYDDSIVDDWKPWGSGEFR